MSKSIIRKGFVMGIILLFLGASLVSITSGNNGFTGYWKFDEGSGNTAQDSSGNGNHVTIYGASWTQGYMRSDFALDFRGIGYDDYVSLDAHASNLAFDMTDDCIVEAWFNVRGSHGGMIYSICHYTGADPGFWVSVNSDSVTVDIQKAGVYLRASAYDNYGDGDWHHLKGIYEGDTSLPAVELYVDGELKDIDKKYLPSFSASGFQVCKIGRAAHDDFVHHYNGAIDDLKVTCTEQVAPNTPDKPMGRVNGKSGVSYVYKTRSEDINDDELYYMWDWGDGRYSEWFGPFSSGNEVSESYSWNMGEYEIRVKAKDEHGAESAWSEPLSITMPRNRQMTNHLFMRFLEPFPNAFPVIRYILGL